MLSEQEERRRVAELIHDGPVQQLSAISQMLDAGLADLESGESERAREVFARGLELTRDAARDLRQLCDDLEPRVLHQLGFHPPPPRSSGGSRLATTSRSTSTSPSPTNRRERRSRAVPDPSRGDRASGQARDALSHRDLRKANAGRRHRAHRGGRRSAGAPRRSARGARRARGDAQRPVQLGGAPSAWIDHPDRRASRRRASLGSRRGRERQERLSLLRLVTRRLHAHRANRGPAAARHRGRGRRAALSSDEDRVVAAARRSAPVRIPLARLTYSRGSFWTLCSVAYAFVSALIFAGSEMRS